MSDLSEREILSCLKENYAEAASRCDRLAKGERGDLYPKLRENLRLVEGAARQMSAWREDSRWLKLGLDVMECQKRCGKWLVEKAPGKKFTMLANVLRKGAFMAHALETRKTEVRGPILPIIAPAPNEQRHGSIILPPGYNTTH